MAEAGKIGLRTIPEPVLDFFRIALGQSLIVKGESGTGKTTFTLSLLEDLLQEHYESKHFIYVTARMSSESLSTHFKSFKIALLPDSVIDATRFEEKKVDESSLVAFDEKSFLKLLKKWIGRKRHPVIVVDSLESLAQRLNTDPSTLAYSLNNLGKAKNAKSVYIFDSSDASPIDHIVDGIIILSMKEESDHIERKLHIRKLRGTSIGSGSQSFTLVDNQFSKLWSVSDESLRKIRSFKATPHSGTRFFTGVTELDSILGGFRLGSTCYLDVGSNVGSEIVNTFILSVVANFMKQKGGVVMIPPNKMSYRTLKSAALRFDFVDQLNTNLRLLTYQFADPAVVSEKPEAMEEYWKPIKISSSNELEKEMDLALGEVQANGCNDNLFVLGLGFLKSWLGPKNLDRWAMRMATMAGEESGLALLIGYSSTSDENPAMMDVSDVHISLSTKSGITLFRGVHPRTPYYSVYTFETDGGIHIGFQEIA